MLSEACTGSLVLRRNDGQQAANRLWPWPCHCTYLAPNPIQPDEKQEEKIKKKHGGTRKTERHTWPTDENARERKRERDARESIENVRTPIRILVICETAVEDSVIASSSRERFFDERTKHVVDTCSRNYVTLQDGKTHEKRTTSHFLFICIPRYNPRTREDKRF